MVSSSCLIRSVIWHVTRWRSQSHNSHLTTIRQTSWCTMTNRHTYEREKPRAANIGIAFFCSFFSSNSNQNGMDDRIEFNRRRLFHFAFSLHTFYLNFLLRISFLIDRQQHTQKKMSLKSWTQKIYKINDKKNMKMIFARIRPSTHAHAPSIFRSSHCDVLA